MTSFRGLAEQALTQNGGDQTAAAMRGIGYAILALGEAVEEPTPEAAEALESMREVVAAGEKDTVRRAEALARGILERQLVHGEATMEWDSRGESAQRRITLARMILDAHHESPGVLATELAVQFGLSLSAVDRILEHADHVLGVEAEDVSENGAEHAEEARNLLLACGWEPGHPEEEDAEVFWTFGDYGPMPAQEAVQLISNEGRCIGYAPGQDPEKLRAKADAVLYGQGYVCGGRRLPPDAVHVFTSAPARGTLTP